jgi:hypothetical protein
MRKLLKTIINYIINGDSDSVISKTLGIADIIEALPFRVPSRVEINATIDLIVSRQFADKDVEKISVMGIMAQQLEEPSSRNYFPELEAAAKVKVWYSPRDLNGDDSFTVLIYGDARRDSQGILSCTWQFIGRAPNRVKGAK